MEVKKMGSERFHDSEVPDAGNPRKTDVPPDLIYA